MDSSIQEEEFIIPIKYSDLTEQSDDLRRFSIENTVEFESSADVTQALNIVEGMTFV